MKSAGVAVDKDSLKAFYKVMDGKDVPTLVKDGEARKLKWTERLKSFGQLAYMTFKLFDEPANK